jgi:acetyl-CoA C-acetyltransferase
MVRRVRDGVKYGLLYGQGGFVTKHHALVLSPNTPPMPLSDSVSVQAIADKRRTEPPKFNPDAVGAATVESFTVIYDRDGAAKHGVVILRNDQNERTLARVPANDKATLARLLDLDRSPIGSTGTIGRADDGMREWKAA